MAILHSIPYEMGFYICYITFILAGPRRAAGPSYLQKKNLLEKKQRQAKKNMVMMAFNFSQFGLAVYILH